MASRDELKPVLGYAPPPRQPGRRAKFWDPFFNTVLLIFLLGVVLAVALFFYVSITIGGRD